MDGEINRGTETDRQTQTDREIEGVRYRQTKMEKHRDRQRQTDRKTEGVRDRQTDRDREKHTEIQTGSQGESGRQSKYRFIVFQSCRDRKSEPTIHSVNFHSSKCVEYVKNSTSTN